MLLNVIPIAFYAKGNVEQMTALKLYFYVLEITVKIIGERMTIAGGITYKKKENTHICPIKTPTDYAIRWRRFG